jgi:hypothetical protein
MKKLREQQMFIQNLEILLTKMESEIELLRSIAHRYYIMHGHKIQAGLVFTPENISFGITVDGYDVSCQLLDHDELGIESDYQKIKNQLNQIK